jgi:hypothetical protein
VLAASGSSSFAHFFYHFKRLNGCVSLDAERVTMLRWKSLCMVLLSCSRTTSLDNQHDVDGMCSNGPIT